MHINLQVLLHDPDSASPLANVMNSLSLTLLLVLFLLGKCCVSVLFFMVSPMPKIFSHIFLILLHISFPFHVILLLYSASVVTIPVIFVIRL